MWIYRYILGIGTYLYAKLAQVGVYFVALPPSPRCATVRLFYFWGDRGRGAEFSVRGLRRPRELRIVAMVAECGFACSRACVL